MPKEPVYLTAKGKVELEDELKELLEVARPAIAKTILAAREDGDLKENGAYHDAKDRQGHLEARIRLLKDRLLRAQVIDVPTTQETVNLGSFVTIVDDTGAEQRYEIVGSMEANVRAGRISNESPIGKALMGRKVGEKAPVQTPGGELQYAITAIE